MPELGPAQIVSRLEIHPELRRSVEMSGKADCQIGADPELAFHKLFDLTFGPVRGHGQIHDSHAQRLHEFLIQNLARMNRAHTIAVHCSPPEAALSGQTGASDSAIQDRRHPFAGVLQLLGHSPTNISVCAQLRSTYACHYIGKRNTPIKMEVSVKDKKRKEKLFQIVDLHLEALRLAGDMSANQRRFIEVAVTCGPALEPSGALAGRRS